MARLGLVVLAALALAGAPAHAQETAVPPAEPAKPRVEAPELVEFAEAEYPARALEARREAKVVLNLSLDEQGGVTAAEVVSPAGDGFDEAAIAAALRFRFRPARRDGAPVAVRILYSYEFRVPPDPEPEPEPELGAAPPPVETPPAEAPAPAAEEVDITVQGLSDAERLRESAQAVQVIETEQAKRQSADLGEVLARSEGIGVRRGGGLGSATRFSLNGLTDDQIRFFLDGVPLELAGYPFGIANVPVNLVERVEVYRGVVPVRFGADALGGAVNLVTDDELYGTHFAASYQAGSFDTQRATASVRTHDPESGFFVRASAFYDTSANDYPVDVEVPNEQGRPIPARAHRFHDGYRAAGWNVEGGLVDRPWARRLLARVFFTDYTKELQNNVVMTVPYGEVEYGESNVGGSLRYQELVSERVPVDVLAGYSYGELHFQDTAECVYDWFGRCVHERLQPGEIEAKARDQLIWDKTGFGRVTVGYLAPQHQTFRLALTPTYTTRTGDERRQSDPDARDPLTARRDLFTLVGGLEHEIEAFDDVLANIAFVKTYVQSARSEEPLPGGLFRKRDRDTREYGFGDSLRVRLGENLYAKASYEWALRLPRPDELFGDGVLVVANLELLPERSHNANLGFTAEAPNLAVGALHADLNGFLRDADHLIVLLGNDRLFTYQNVFSARSLGVEASAGWRSPGELLSLDGNVTYQDFRNTASSGTFGSFDGDRIPNRPYLFANGSAELELRGVGAPNDELSFFWYTRYVHEFFRGWESVGLRESKQVVDAQLLHSAALVYLVRGALTTLGFTGEVDNITDEKAYDFFGVQRPGRAFYFKTTLEH
jgi:TonB family protein